MAKNKQQDQQCIKNCVESWSKISNWICSRRGLVPLSPFVLLSLPHPKLFPLLFISSHPFSPLIYVLSHHLSFIPSCFSSLFFILLSSFFPFFFLIFLLLPYVVFHPMMLLRLRRRFPPNL